LNDLLPSPTTTTTTTTTERTTRTLPTLSSSTQSTRTFPISPTLPERQPSLPPFPDFESIIDNLIEERFPDNETLEFDYCADWYGILGYGVPIPIRFSHKLAVVGLFTDAIIFLSAIYYGMNTIVFELMFLSTVLSLTKLLGLIGTDDYNFFIDFY
jgi:hypothetical protein